jgi:hypothetical protein
MYDANVGRFLSKDPRHQYWSPYEGMGNNPVSGTDPTGGWGDVEETPPGGGPVPRDQLGNPTSSNKLFSNPNKTSSNSTNTTVPKSTSASDPDYALQVAIEINKFNPIACGANAIWGAATGHDINGVPQSGGDIAMNAAAAIPVGKVVRVASGVAETGITVYRAVSAAEAAVIKSSGEFSVQEGGLMGKYFAKSVEDANWYGQNLYPEGYTIIQGTVKGPVNASQFWHQHIDIGAYYFPEETLPFIVPK